MLNHYTELRNTLRLCGPTSRHSLSWNLMWFFVLARSQYELVPLMLEYWSK